MMKLKIKALLLIMLSSLFMGSFNVAYALFSDVPSGNENYDAINYVQAQGFVSGYPDGTFKPDNKITRAEFTKIVINSKYTAAVIDACIGENISSTATTVYFPDVLKTDWFAKYVCVAKKNNIIQGYPDGTFKPANEINFVEAAKIIVTTFGSTVTAGDPWYKPFVDDMAGDKAIPTSIASFSGSITRGQMAEMIYRLKANITTKPSLTYDLLNVMMSPARAITFDTNGDYISTWYWLRDIGLKQYATWIITAVPTDKKSIELDMTALATNTYSGGKGFDANFRLFYGSTVDASYGYIDVTLPNVSPENDPVGYTCTDKVLIPTAAMNGGTVLVVKAKRMATTDNHIAFNDQTITAVNGSDTESSGSLGDGTTGDETTDDGTTNGGTTDGGTTTGGTFEYSDVDTDNDGMPDTMEDLYGTNPNLADTDGDGVKDSEDLSPLINPTEPAFLELQKIGMVRIQQPIQAWGLDGWAEKWHKNALCDLKFDASYEDTGTKKSSMDQTHYKLALNKVFAPDNFVTYKMENILPSDIDVQDTEKTHDKISEDSYTFNSTCIVTPNEYKFFYDYITDYQLAYLKNTIEKKYPNDTTYYRYLLNTIKLKTSKEQFITFQFTDSAMYNAMYDTDATHYKMPAFQYSFYSSSSYNTDSNVPYYEAMTIASPEAVNRFSATIHIPKEKNTHSTAYLKITPMWITKNGYPVSYDPMIPSWAITGITRSTVISRDDQGNSKTMTEEMSNFDGLNTTVRDATYFTAKRTLADYSTHSGWMGIISKDTNASTTTPYTVMDVLNKIEKYVEHTGAQASNAITYTENMVQAINKVDKIENLPSTHWARSPKYNGAVAGLSTATGIISIVTNGNEAWKAIKSGESADVIYYSAKVGLGAAQTASSLAQISQRTIGYAGKAGRFAKLASDKFAVGLAVAIGAVEVSYDIYKLSQATDPIAQAAYTEKIASDIIDTEISVGAVFSPHILVFQVTWTVEAEIYSWIFGEDFAYKIAQSPGKALVFLATYFLTSTIPSAMAQEAYLDVRGDCPDTNILNCYGIIGQIRRLNDVQLPYLSIFIDPDV